MPDRRRQGLPALRAEGGELAMAADKTLDLDVAAITAESRRLAASIKPGSGSWDVIVVGSGAAGGMAAFQLATAGIKVLMLEAGRMLDHKAEYRTMEWPYASPRRGRLPLDHRPIAVAEYSFLDRPYGANPQMAKYAQGDLVRGEHLHAQLGRQREGAPDHGHAVLVGTRARARGQDQLLGTRGAALRAATVRRGPPRRIRRGLAHPLLGRVAATTTRSTSSSAAPAPMKAWTRCRTASSSGRASSTAWRWPSSARSRPWAATTSRDGPG